ncbi:hypothetical protein LCGC14_2872510, partial [marine sediment metagenome]
MLNESGNQQLNSDSSTHGKPMIPWTIFLIVLGVIAFIFFTYEVVERVWLDEVGMNVLH